MTGFRSAAIASLVLLLGGCESIGYYAQSVHGHLDLMSRTQAIDSLLDDPATPAELAGRLRHTQAIRAFASEVLKLPENDSYRDYADLERDTLVWSVVAAAEFSVQPKQWCYPVIGCASYRGYFDRQQAESFARELADDGYDVVVQPVQAYSTLGWFDDPLTNTVIHRDEAGLAALIFHELAHQRVYVKGDSAFNESYATAVEEIGLELWLSERDPQQLKSWYMRKRRYQNRLRLLTETRVELERLYADKAFPADVMREQKRVIFEQLRDALSRQQMAREKGKTKPATQENELLNNAHLASVATYHQWVPAFRAIWRQQGRDPAAFHRAVEAVSGLSRVERDARLQALTP